MHVFYHPEQTIETGFLSESESHHAIKVLRLKAGDKAMVLDGRGGKLEVVLTETDPRKCAFRVNFREEVKPRGYNVHIAIAPVKMNDRMEWFLEKATEIGVDRITPVWCERSERKQINSERWEKTVIAAMKQCKWPWKPDIANAVSLRDFIGNSEPGFIAWCGDETFKQLQKQDFSQDKITVLVGPEGDFTENEVKIAIEHLWTPVSLGPSRLRTETAGLVACMTVHLMKGI
jgi:16S rRNA (uracil1498-N3)-methyltransferase